MSAALVTAIQTKLASDVTATSFHVAVGGRYYHMESPEGEPQSNLPLCVWGVSDPASLDMSFGGQEMEEWRITFAIFVSVTAAGNPDIDALGIDAKLRTLLHKATLSISGYDRLTVLCESQGFATKEGDVVRVESVYRVFGART